MSGLRDGAAHVHAQPRLLGGCVGEEGGRARGGLEALLQLEHAQREDLVRVRVRVGVRVGVEGMVRVRVGVRVSASTCPLYVACAALGSSCLGGVALGSWSTIAPARLIHAARFVPQLLLTSPRSIESSSNSSCRATWLGVGVRVGVGVGG